MAVGRGSEAGGIHRELWGPGVTSVVQAVLHANDLVLERLRQLGDGDAHVVDLGCGVGGSLCHLLARHPGRGTGLTLSAAQVALTRERVAAHGLANRVDVVQGDFCAPPELAPVDVAFAIEAFVHGTDPAAFFRAVAGMLRPGGRLVIIDDFLGRPAERWTEWESAAVNRFRTGWRIGSLMTPSEAASRAKEAGLVLDEDLDLTGLLRLGRLRDRWVQLWVTLLGWLPIRHPYWQSLQGGDALQACLRSRVVTYRLLSFQRPNKIG